MKKQHAITAIIYDKRGRVLSVGQNSYVKSHTVMARHANKVGLPEKIYLHAEAHSIIKCRNLKKAYKIAVFRYNKQGAPANAKPCPICQSLINEAGIKEVMWTEDGCNEWIV